MWRKRKRKQENKNISSAASISFPPILIPPTTPTTTPTTTAWMSAVRLSTNPFEEPVAPLVVEDRGLAIEPIVGWRSYYVDTEDMSLVSFNGAYWPQREPFHAICQNDLFANHDVPSEDCVCGIYAWHESFAEAAAGNVYGEVYLWGDVLICPSGYRAEIAYPKSLTLRVQTLTRVVNRMRDGLQEAYGVPVAIVMDNYEPKDQPF